MSWKGRLSCLTRSIMSPGEPLVLMYHRVADLRYDPWNIAVSPENFRQQMRILSQTRKVVPLSTLVRETKRGGGKGMIAVTFDDAYIDVYENALPILQEFKCPATVFMVPGMLDLKRSFWWDELTRIICATPELPTEFRFPHDLGVDDFTWSHKDRNPDDRTRRSLYYAFWRRLHDMEPGRRDECLASIADWAGVTLYSDPSDRAMSSAQAARMASMNLIEIGAHTMTHPSLPTLSRDAQFQEMKASKLACEEIVGGRIERFAYPFGDFNADTIEAAREAGFAAAFTTKAGTMSKARDPLLFPRMNIGNYAPERFRFALAVNFAVPDALPLSVSERLKLSVPSLTTFSLSKGV